MPMVRSSGRVVGWAMTTRTVLRLRYGQRLSVYFVIMLRVCQPIRRLYFRANITIEFTHFIIVSQGENILFHSPRFKYMYRYVNDLNI